MKSLKKLMAGAACGLMTLGATAQESLIAGWEFSQFSFAAINSVGEFGASGDFSQAGALNANYSELLPGSPAGGPLAAGFGTLYYDGTNGSTDGGPFDLTGTNTIYPFAQTLTSEADQVSPNYGTSASENVLIFNGQEVYNPFGLKIEQDNSLVVAADALLPATDWQLKFAYQTEGPTDGGQVIDFEYLSGDGWIGVGSPVTVTQTDSGTTLDIPGLDGFQVGVIRLNISGASETNAVVVDNIGAFAAPVPEPSTLAALVTLTVFGSLLIRRRIKR